MEGIKLTAIGDIHYSTGPSEIESRKAQFGLELLKRVFKRFSWKEKSDVIVIAGDILDKVLDDTEKLLNEVKDTLNSTRIPAILVPGNHDGDYKKFSSTLGKFPDPYIVRNFIIFPFVDIYEEGDICRRKGEDIKKFISTVRRYPEKNIIVVQHNPVYPRIENSYPYNIADAEEIHKIYRENRVLLSISGHYHPGQELTCKDGVYYLTIPALCEDPFRYVEIEIKDNKITTTTRQIKDPLPLSDNHCHTQFAYCAEDITIEKVLERAEILGMGYVCFTEHADQLYLTEEEYGKALSFYQPDILRRKREEGKDRMTLFRKAVNEVKSEKVRIGLEVIPDKNGGISLLPEDRQWLDVVVGAIHFFPEEIMSATSTKREVWFIDMIEILMKNNVDILAHPFRVFLRSGLKVPETLFSPVVDLLKSYNVAAELNFHTNTPEYKFFEMCLKEGIKISLGTDTHNLLEVGDFYPHIRFLGELGVLPDKFDKILYLIP